MSLGLYPIQIGFLLDQLGLVLPPLSSSRVLSVPRVLADIRCKRRMKNTLRLTSFNNPNHLS